jgi:hypothetical protein
LRFLQVRLLLFRQRPIPDGAEAGLRVVEALVDRAVVLPLLGGS